MSRKADALESILKDSLLVGTNIRQGVGLGELWSKAERNVGAPHYPRDNGCESLPGPAVPHQQCHSQPLSVRWQPAVDRFASKAVAHGKVTLWQTKLTSLLFCERPAEMLMHDWRQPTRVAGSRVGKGSRSKAGTSGQGYEPLTLISRDPPIGHSFVQAAICRQSMDPNHDQVTYIWRAGRTVQL